MWTRTDRLERRLAQSDSPFVERLGKGDLRSVRDLSAAHKKGPAGIPPDRPFDSPELSALSVETC